MNDWKKYVQSFLIAQAKAWRLLHMETVSVCLSVCLSVNDIFEPRDWSTRLPEFKTGSAVQTRIQQSV